MTCILISQGKQRIIAHDIAWISQMDGSLSISGSDGMTVFGDEPDLRPDGLEPWSIKVLDDCQKTIAEMRPPFQSILKEVGQCAKIKQNRWKLEDADSGFLW